MVEDESDRDSAPCFAHLVVDGHAFDPETARDVARFRRAERTRLLASRTLPSKGRQKATASLIVGLERLIAPEAGTNIAVYWPIRGEPDLRAWMRMVHAAGAKVLLPVVIQEQAPLEFHSWRPGCEMTRGSSKASLERNMVAIKQAR